jgi:hypothetical protein
MGEDRSPSDLQSNRRSLSWVINFKTAKQVGLTISQGVLRRTEKVVINDRTLRCLGKGTATKNLSQTP